MCRFVKRLLVWAVAAAILMVASPDEARSDADEAKRLIVMIEGKMQGAKVIGAGIIIGSHADRLYIATANHVVRRGTKRLEQVRVRLKLLPGQEVEAEVLSDFDRNLDLAVLSVKGVKALAIPVDEIPFQLLGPAAGLKRGDEVFTIGYPRGMRWQVNVNPDRIAENIGDSLAFESQLVAKGHSGGGLFNKDWELVGMITADQPPNGVAARIDRVLKQLKRWDYPVKLTPRTATSPRTVQDAAAAAKTRQEIDASQPWRYAWTCRLRFAGGGTATLRMDAADSALGIPSWSLDMNTPFDSLIYRSSSKSTGLGIWFAKTGQFLFRTRVKRISGRDHIRASLSGFAVAGDKPGELLITRGALRGADKGERYRFEGHCTT